MLFNEGDELAWQIIQRTKVAGNEILSFPKSVFSELRHNSHVSGANWT